MVSDAEVHSDVVYRSIERNALPALGELPIGVIDSALVLEVWIGTQSGTPEECCQAIDRVPNPYRDRGPDRRRPARLRNP